jgi:hypothetical protein|tara:strand:+ start:748 stop:921 length:174 start_codon:yes stop_codon:yes gene_type:complete
MLKVKRGRPKNITVPLVKSKSPYGNIEVVSSKGQKIKPNERITKANFKSQNRTFRKK